MKPIKLEIKGFQSFRGKQIVDFESLTSMGLFGIYGATGSGKSSILDAMIFALYGKTRTKQNEFINLNENESFVEFTFQLRMNNVPRRFVVRRITRRKKNSKKYESTTVSFYEVDLDTGAYKALSEKVTDTNRLIEEYIGLQESDFTRAVVLPQGKFNEFLTIDPKDRNDMLERIFGLESFGRQLSEKIRLATRENADAKSMRETILLEYKDVSNENFSAMQKELSELVVDFSEKKVAKDLLAQKVQDAKIIRDLQTDLEKARSIETDLLNKEQDMIEIEMQITKSKHAGEILPTLNLAKEGQEQLNLYQDNLAQLTDQRIQLEQDHEKAESELADAIKNKERFLPYFILKKSELEEIMSLADENQAVKNELDQQEKEVKKDASALQKVVTEAEKLNSEKQQVEERYSQKKELINSLEVNREDRKNFSTALDYEKTLKYHTEQIEVLDQDALHKSKKCEKMKEELQIKEKQMLKLDDEISQVENQVAKLSAIPVLSNTEIQEHQLLVYDQTEKCLKIKNAVELLNTKITEKDVCEKTITTLKSKLIEKKAVQRNAQTKFKADSAEFEKLKLNNLAGILANNIQKSNLPCPVCGNTDIVQLAPKPDIDQLNHTERELNEVQEILKQANKEVNNLENQLQLNQEQLKKLTIETEEMVHLTQGTTYEAEEKTRQTLAAAIEKSIEARKSIEEELSILSTQLNTLKDHKAQITTEIEVLKNNLNHSENQLMDINQVKNKLDEIIVETNKLLQPIKQKHENQSFEQLLEEIEKKDIEREAAMVEMKSIEEERLALLNQYEKLQTKLKAKESIYNQSNQVYLQKQQIYEKRMEDIGNVCGEKEPRAYLEEIEAEDLRIQTNIATAENNLQVIKTQLNQKVKEIFELQGNIEATTHTIAKHESMAKVLIFQYKFADADEVYESFIVEDKRKEFEKEVTKYREDLNIVKSKIKELTGILRLQKVSDEEWGELTENLTEASSELDEIMHKKGSLETSIAQMEKSLEFMQEHVEALRELQGRQVLLDDLSGVLKGNKFVEFIAQNQLKYVASEASSRLKEISKGKFSLILDDQSMKFMICDHNSGGEIRSTDSLSGGEQFLTSLALALALSSHIQLKNRAPLEFFFLDEGFGTLDESTIDEAMTSLEKIQSEHMSIGIITHVKDIQNRLLIKLHVESANIGGGTVVKLVY